MRDRLKHRIGCGIFLAIPTGLTGMLLTSSRDQTQTVRVVVTAWCEIEGVFLPATVTATDPSGDYVLDFKTIYPFFLSVGFTPP